MAIKVFYELRTLHPLSFDSASSLLAVSIRDASSRFSWRFGPDRYEPQHYAYDPDNRLRSFDIQNQLVISRVPDFDGDFWNFVEKQCESDEVEPQVFGEAVRVRYAVSDPRSVLVRFTFNHALVDGLQIFRFLAGWERSICGDGHELIPTRLGDDETRRRWKSKRTEYIVENLSRNNAPDLTRRGTTYLPILYEIVSRGHYKRVRQAVAVPRNGRIQLALAPVFVTRDYEEFCRRNEVNIRLARSGNRFTRMLDLYRQVPEVGDFIARALIADPVAGRRIISRILGDMLVSSFMYKHPGCLAFPVVHALQQEGVAICCIWSGNDGAAVRLTRARKLPETTIAYAPGPDSRVSEKV